MRVSTVMPHNSLSLAQSNADFLAYKSSSISLKCCPSLKYLKTVRVYSHIEIMAILSQLRAHFYIPT